MNFHIGLTLVVMYLPGSPFFFGKEGCDRLIWVLLMSECDRVHCTLTKFSSKVGHFSQNYLLKHFFDNCHRQKKTVGVIRETNEIITLVERAGFIILGINYHSH